MEHTKGPWKLFEKYIPYEYDYFYVKTKAKCICSISFTKDEEQRANAHLIAAAPDLLEACKATLEAIQGADDYLERKIKQAITKAGQA